ncbi:MAG: hypothetical protein Q7Q71_08145 [Verrucomicrobiota bacterium JB023]|nr:hypothetical protein [Verrucomicrobiota bacterium JB023]
MSCHPQPEVAAFLKLAATMGWVSEERDDVGLHLSLKRTYSALYYWIGIFTIPLFGVGLLVWLAGYIEYHCRRDRRLFVPFTDLTGERVGRAADSLL